MPQRRFRVILEIAFVFILSAPLGFGDNHTPPTSVPQLSDAQKIEILKLQRDVNYKAALLQQKMQEVNALKEEFDKINLELQSKIKALSVQGYTFDFVNLEYKKNAEDTKKQQKGN